MQHLDYPNTYARILFVDYSSAFNTVIPQQLYDKLPLLSLDPSMCYWLLDFLLQRSQVVKMNMQYSFQYYYHEYGDSSGMCPFPIAIFSVYK